MHLRLRAARSHRRVLLCALAGGLIAALPVDLAAQETRRRALLLASGDSIRVGQYAWAESTLQSLLADNASDDLATTLLTVAIAGQGDIPRARKTALRLESEKRRAGVTRLVDRFELAHGIRSRFQEAIKMGDVRAATASLKTDALGPRELALARGALCVLAGNRACLDAQASLIAADTTTEVHRKLLYEQLASADSAASAYSAAVRAFLRDASGSWLNSEDFALHQRCSEQRGDDQQKCRQELIGRLMALATDVVRAAPLSKSGLEAAVAVGMLTEDLKSTRSNVGRMKMAMGEVSLPVWANVKTPNKEAFGKKVGGRAQYLKIDADSVMLVASPGPERSALEPLFIEYESVKADSSSDSRRVRVWAIARSDVSTEGQAFRQKISWDSNRRELSDEGVGGQLRTSGGAYEIPYPLGLYHFGMAYGEVPSRAVLRNFGRTIGEVLQLNENRIEVVDSIQKKSRFGTMFNGLMAATAAATGDATALGFWTSRMNEANRKEQQSRDQRREWVSATRDNATLRNLFDYAIRKEWLEFLLRELPRVSGGA